jgi:hypothetical protein
MRKGARFQAPAAIFTLCNNQSVGMEAPPTTRNLLFVKILRKLSALSLMAASSVLVSMWWYLPSTQLQRLQTF